ncbi:MAG: pyrroline-5-carboxylate reductase [Balneolaceae bacterium]|nr:pyrroline-5-carboxylate reductase [Balneolaceae bacterium]MBO6545243.1 pyrroline-5-carboxylate reductase [Balneolaceae bacterium]MBO6646639.1 pyrroline-5-carboxylate reductase [Balneolaceae bacterium]
MSTNKHIAILGAGNLGEAIAKGFAGNFGAGNITLTRRHLSRLDHLKERGFQTTSDNKEAVSKATYIFLCVQPKQLEDVVKGIEPVLDAKKHILVSTITGVSLDVIQSYLKDEFAIIRAMPNTAAAISESMTCVCGNELAGDHLSKVEEMFKSLGETLIIEERLMKAATVLAASGIAFFLRYIRAATQGGIELGFEAEEAQKIAMQTARGAASLLVEGSAHPEREIDKVTTPMGCTIAGLNEMEHQGLSSALIKGIVASFEKINRITE